MSGSNTPRDDKGRFRAGNPGGPGRPRRAVESDYLATLCDAVPLAKWRRITKKAVEDALAGDRHAREWLGTFLVGKPEPGGLLELVARELAGYDSVRSRASTFAMLKPMVDSRASLFLRGTGGGEPEQT
jgi:hypothetical protein